MGGPAMDRASGAGRAAGRGAAPRTDHRRTGRTLRKVTILRPGAPRRTHHQAMRSRRAGGVAGRARTRERAGAARAAVALTIGAGAAAGRVRRAAHVTGRRLAGEGAMAATLARAGAVGALAVAGGVVSFATNGAGGSATDEVAGVTCGAGTGSILAIPGGAVTSREDRGAHAQQAHQGEHIQDRDRSHGHGEKVHAEISQSRKRTNRKTSSRPSEKCWPTQSPGAISSPKVTGARASRASSPNGTRTPAKIPRLRQSPPGLTVLPHQPRAIPSTGPTPR